MKKNIFFNVIMILLAFFIILGSIMTVYEFSNTIGTEQEAHILVKNVTGPNTLHRSGIGYSLKNDLGIKAGDSVMTGSGSTCSLSVWSDSMIHLCKDTETAIDKITGETVELRPVYGTFFAEVKKTKEASFVIKVQQAVCQVVENSVFTLESLNGSQTINVFSGQVKVTYKGEDTLLGVNECAVLIQEETGGSRISFEEIKTARMSREMIDFLLTTKEDTYEDKELTEVLAKREQEAEAEKTAQRAREAEILAKGGTVLVYTDKGVRPLKQEELTDQKETVNQNNLPGLKNPSNQKNPSGQIGTASDGKTGICTLQIRCDNILSNIEKLNENKRKFVPEHGIILETSRVQFTQGESVFDVLKRTCDLKEIPLVYEWTVEFDGNYVQGINNLKEFDCGEKSGWMYKVNGWFPNYGCSVYEVKEGDVIVWTYTCNLGADVGAPF